MEKKLVNFRLPVELINKLDQLSRETGKNKTQLIEEAIMCLLSSKDKENKEIALLEKQNEQLKQALQGFQIALQGKDELLREREERIKELKETIQILKQSEDQKKKSKKPFWQFWR